MAGTQLYDKNHDPIYPIGRDEDINSSAISGTATVNQALSYLSDKVNQLSGDSPAVTSIKVDITYAKTYINSQSSIKVATSADGVNWNPDFRQPDSENPYTWKKTIFRVGNTEYIYYEIVATTMIEKTQTIYLAINSSLNEVQLPTVEDDGSIESWNSWTEEPQAISAAKPDLFMATRKMEKGRWKSFSQPTQCGKWAYDSQLLIRYRTTEIDNTEVPYVNKTMDAPTDWSLTSPRELSGKKLWMITATAINGAPTAYDGNNKWSDPNLISIIQ